ncbi:Pectic enzymes secretion protein outC [Campylobacter jejuni]|nr:Pectic enzymes secretion protein outC [Campylobacter jejuni]
MINTRCFFPFLNNQKMLIKKYLVCGLAGLMSYQLAILTWQIVDRHNDIDEPLAVSISPPMPLPRHEHERRNNGAGDALPDSVYQLFGHAVSVPSSDGQVLSAVQSRLKAKVTGIITSTVASRSIAIIEHNGRQASYAINDAIEGTDAVITHILIDKVLVSLQGNQEMLRFDEDAATPAQSLPNLPNLRQEMLKEPDKILAFVIITPVKLDEVLQGYRLNPGPKPELFKQSGLQANDLAIAINGVDLRNREAAEQLMATINEQMQLSITVLRNGAEELVFVDFAGQ